MRSVQDAQPRLDLPRTEISRVKQELPIRKAKSVLSPRVSPPSSHHRSVHAHRQEPTREGGHDVPVRRWSRRSRPQLIRDRAAGPCEWGEGRGWAMSRTVENGRVGRRHGNVRGGQIPGSARTHAHGRAYDATLEAVPVRRPAHRATGRARLTSRPDVSHLLLTPLTFARCGWWAHWAATFGSGEPELQTRSNLKKCPHNL